MAQADYFSKREPLLYYIEAKTDEIGDRRLIKIGISSTLKTRVKQIQTGCPFPIEVIKTSQRSYPFAIDAEKFLHEELKSYRSIGEWFLLHSDQVDTLFAFMDGFLDYPSRLKEVWHNCHWDFAPIAQHPVISLDQAQENNRLEVLREAAATISFPIDDGAPRKNAA